MDKKLAKLVASVNTALDAESVDNEQLVNAVASVLNATNDCKVWPKMKDDAVQRLAQDGFVASKLGTGEGKTHSDMIVMACKALKGQPVALELSSSLAKRDMEAYKGFMDALLLNMSAISNPGDDVDTFTVRKQGKIDERQLEGRNTRGGEVADYKDYAQQLRDEADGPQEDSSPKI